MIGHCILDRINSSYIYQLDTYSLPEGTALPKSIQGGAFYKGDLYLATDEGDAVYQVSCNLCCRRRNRQRFGGLIRAGGPGCRNRNRGTEGCIPQP